MRQNDNRELGNPDAARLEELVAELSKCVAQLEAEQPSQSAVSVTTRKLIDSLQAELASFLERERAHREMVLNLLKSAERQITQDGRPDDAALRQDDTQRAALLARYHELVQQKHLHRLTDAEAAEMRQINEALDALDESFYAPIVENLRARVRAKTGLDA